MIFFETGETVCDNTVRDLDLYGIIKPYSINIKYHSDYELVLLDTEFNKKP